MSAVPNPRPAQPAHGATHPAPQPPQQLRSYQAGDANRIDEILCRKSTALSANDRAFLFLVQRETFGNAGFRRLPEHWCHFDLPAWAARMGQHKPNVLRTRDRLVSLRVLHWEPDPDEPGCGRLGWNLNFAEWLPLQDSYRRQRYARVGAGRQRRQQADVISLNSGRADQAGVISLNSEDFSKGERLPATTLFKRRTPDRYGARAEAAPQPAKNTYREERKKQQHTACTDQPGGSVVGAVSSLSSRAEIGERSGALGDGTAPPQQAPTEAPTNELSDEYRAILRVLHAIPGWLVHAERERRLLDGLCAPTDGGDDWYEPAFVLRRAREFADWWADIDPKGAPDTRRFRTFMRNTPRENYARWQAEQAQARARARAAQRYYDPDAEAKRRRDEEELIAELIRLGVRKPSPRAAPGTNPREEWKRRYEEWKRPREESGHNEVPGHRTATTRPSAASGRETGALS